MAETTSRTTEKVLRSVVILLSLLALACEVIYAPSQFTRSLMDSQLANSFAIIRNNFSFETLVAYSLGLRYLAALMFWLGALLVLLDVGWPSTRYTSIGLAIALLFSLLPLTLTLGISGADPQIANPWNFGVIVLTAVLSGTGLLLLITSYYLFPTGQTAKTWLRWFNVILVVVLLILLTASMTGFSTSDWLWPAMMISLLIGLVGGVIALLYRYFRFSEAAQKRQIKLPVIAFTAQLFIFGTIFNSGEPSWLALFLYHLQIILPALLPLAILFAMYRRKLWEIPGSPYQLKRAGLLGLSGIIAGVSIICILLLTNRLVPGEKLVITSLPVNPAPRPVIIDTDLAPDDWMAILYLLNRPDIEVKAITVSGTGEVHCGPGVRNAAGLIALAGEKDIPVACGRETPLVGGHVFPAAWRERADRMAGLTLPVVEDPPPGVSAPELLENTINALPGKTTLLALGPLTNLAVAFHSDPELHNKVEDIIVMGGALEVLGNLQFGGIDNQVAEWNIYIDPAAAKIVLASGVPVTLVPLDATNKVPINLDFYRMLMANQNTPEARFVLKILEKQLDAIAQGFSYFWDPLAAAILVDPDLGYIKDGQVLLITQEGPSSGKIRLAAGGSPIRYVKTADTEAFYQDFLQTLNQP